MPPCVKIQGGGYVMSARPGMTVTSIEQRRRRTMSRSLLAVTLISIMLVILNSVCTAEVIEDHALPWWDQIASYYTPGMDDPPPEPIPRFGFRDLLVDSHLYCVGVGTVSLTAEYEISNYHSHTLTTMGGHSYLNNIEESSAPDAWFGLIWNQFPNGGWCDAYHRIDIEED